MCAGTGQDQGLPSQEERRKEAGGGDGLRLSGTGEHMRGAPKDRARWWRRRRRPVGKEAGSAGHENGAGHSTGEARFYDEEGEERQGNGEGLGLGARAARTRGSWAGVLSHAGM